MSDKRQKQPRSQPPKAPLRIDRMYAYIASDAEGEGLPAMTMGNTLMPMVGADKERMLSLLPRVQEIASASGAEITLVEFSVRREIQKILPRPEGDLN